MSKARDLLNNTGGGGYFKPTTAIKPVISEVETPAKNAPKGKPNASDRGQKVSGKSGGGSTLPTSVRPKV